MPSEESKFYVWARGRWRELSLSSGRIQGAGPGPVGFLYVKRGKLEAARRSRVLRALKALAGGNPTSVRDGVRVPQRRCVRRRTRHSRSRHHHLCCCGSHKQCNISLVDFTAKQQQAALLPNRVDASTEITDITAAPITETRRNLEPKSPSKPESVQKAETVKVPEKRVKRKRSPTPHQRKTFQDTSSSEGCSLALLKRHNRSIFKELEVYEEDADLYRSYLLKYDLDFDVYRFDSDETYKMKLFYRINPLVSLPYCKRLESMLRERRVSQDTISLKDFANKLGLRSISDNESDSKRYKMRKRNKNSAVQSITEEDTDKENFVENKRSKIPVEPLRDISKEQKRNVTRRDRSIEEEKRKEPSIDNKQKTVDTPVDRNLRKRMMVEAVQRNLNNVAKTDKPIINGKKVVNNSSDSEKEFVEKKKRFFTKKPLAPQGSRVVPLKSVSQVSKSSITSKRSCGGREYSSLEDHAIVAFVSGGDRARLVNGNRVWVELQDQFNRLTGQNRTWHSLRNRYLRYLLPSLGQLALPPHHAARLRAQAARGELKSRKRPSAPNPLCVVKRVRSAFGARASSPAPTTSPTPSPFPTPTPSPPPASPPPPPVSEERVLRTRKKESTDPTPVADVKPTQSRRSLRSSAVAPPSSAPPSGPSAPPGPPAPPQARVRPRMRKLFNPNTGSLR